MLNPISALKNIYSVTKLIYAQAKLVKINPEQSKRLADRIGIIEQNIHNLDQITNKDQYEKGLNDLLAGLQNCLQFMKRLSEVGSFKAFFKAGNYNQEFSKLNEELQKSIQQLNLGLVAQQLFDREKDKADQQADIEFIKKNHEEIISEIQKANVGIGKLDQEKKENHDMVMNEFDSVKTFLIDLDRPVASCSELEAQALTQLKASYLESEYATIPGIFGPPLQLEGQYINLQMLCVDFKIKKIEKDSESKDSAEAKRDEKYKDARMASVEDLFGDKHAIKAKDLFEPVRGLFDKELETVKDGDDVPRLLLVQGRAGIGKTTFVRYVAHEWSKGQLYANYTWVFTLTLRQLRLLPSTRELSLPEWIRQSQFSSWLPKEFEALWRQRIESAINQNKVLLILDGYDETPENHPCQSILKDLLTSGGMYPHLSLLVTTRPCGTQDITERRRNLEIIGFADENINHYIQTYFLKASNKTLVHTLTETLRKQPVIWANAHIPLNLNLLCGIVEEAIQKAHIEGLTQGLAQLSSMTRLYQVMEKKLYERSHSRDDIGSLKIGRQLIRAQTDFIKHYQKERLFLARLAFRSFEAEGIIIPIQVIGDALGAYVDKEVIQGSQRSIQQEKEKLAGELFDEVCKLGLIKPVLHKSGLPQTAQDYEFLHLTFQEYYTAIYLAEGLNNEDPTIKTAIEKVVLKEKYNPRWQIVWWFVAGLLRENAPIYESYLEQLQGRCRGQILTQDILQHYQLGLLARCVDEGFQSSNQQIIEPIVEQLQLSFKALYETTQKLTIKNGLSTIENLALINSPFFSACRMSPNICMKLSVFSFAHLDVRPLKDRGVEQVRFFMAWILIVRIVTPEVLSILTSLLSSEDSEHTFSRSLGAQMVGTLGAAVTTPEVLDALSGLLADKDNEVRRDAVRAVGTLSAAIATTPKILDALVALLGDEDIYVRSSAVLAVRELGVVAATPKILDALIELLLREENNLVCRYAAMAAVRVLSVADITSKRLETLTALLKDKDSAVRYDAVQMVEKLGVVAVTPQVLDTLTGLLVDTKWTVRRSATRAVGALGAVAATPQVLDALLGLLADQDSSVRQYAAEAVGRLGATAATPKILDALAGLLVNEGSDMRCHAVKAMGELGTVAAIPKVVDALSDLLTDKDKWMRRHAVEALGKVGIVAVTPKILDVLSRLLADTDRDVCCFATKAIGKLGAVTVTAKILDALTGLLADKDSNTRRSAAEAIGKLGAVTATPRILDALTRLLADADRKVRRSAAEAIGKLGAVTTPIRMLDALTRLLTDTDKEVRCSAAEAIGKLGAVAATPAFLHQLLDTFSVAGNDNALPIFEICLGSIFTFMPSFWTKNANHPNILVFVSHTLAAAYLNSHVSCQIDFDKDDQVESYYMRGFVEKSSYRFLLTSTQAQCLRRLSPLIIEQLSKTGKLDIAELKACLKEEAIAQTLLLDSTKSSSLKTGDSECVVIHSPEKLFNSSALEQKNPLILTQYHGVARPVPEAISSQTTPLFKTDEQPTVNRNRWRACNACSIS